MKCAAGWIASWALFWPGHWISLLFNLSDPYGEWFAELYPVYNWLMVRSCEVQDWSGCETGPWKEVKDDPASKEG